MGTNVFFFFVLCPLSVKWLCCMHTDMRKERKAGGNACQTLACMWVAHLIIKLIKTSIWQCHPCPAKKEEEGRKSNLNAAVYKDPMSRAAFHQALHVFGLHSHRESGGMWGACKRGKKTAFIGKWQKGIGFWCSKNGSGKINTHQKEQRRNKKRMERAEEIDKDGVTSKVLLKLFKVAIRLGERLFFNSLMTSQH